MPSPLCKNGLKELGTVTHACNPSYSQRQRLRGSWFKASPGKTVLEILSQKYRSQKGLEARLKQ
jgi:hypothetical protein